MALRSFFTLCVIALLLPGAHSADYGILSVDNSTISKVLDGTRPAFVAFGREYPYGEKHDAFKAVATEVAQSSSELLVVYVGIGTYGDKPNQDLAERFGFKKAGTEIDYKDLDDKYPRFIFFPKGSAHDGKFITYDGSANQQDINRFLKSNGVKLGLAGTIAALDEIAERFVQATTAQRAKLTAEAEQVSVSPAQQEAKDYYLKVFARVAEKGEGFVAAEIKRLDGLQTTAVSKAKKEQFKQRANILTSFQSAAHA